MNISDIYERVRTVVSEADERLFINYFNDTAAELDSLYGNVKKLLYCNESHVDAIIESINEENRFLPLYSPAIADNIIYLFNQTALYKQEFFRKAENAHLSYWRNNTKGKTIKSLKNRRDRNDLPK